MAVIDFHAHVLPGIDDGSKTPAMSRQLLREEGRQGVELVVATPHFYAWEQSVPEFLAVREQAAARLRAQGMAGLPGLRLGAEVAFFPGIGRTEGIEALCIEGTRLLLLEMPHAAWSAVTLREVDRLLSRPLQLIIAHFERFYPFQKDTARMDALLERPVWIQINAGSLLDRRTARRCAALFRQGQAHLLGSDCHDPLRRPVNLRQGREALLRRCGPQRLRELDALGTRLLE